MTIEELSNKPLGYSYRVAENVWAGEYPVWDHNKYVRQRQLKILTDFGIGYFVDLTEYGEMPTYAQMLPPDVRRDTLPIPDGGVAKSVEEVTELLERIGAALKDSPETKVYIHCHGGVGRTGTIVACWYIFFGRLTADEAIARMRKHYACHGRSKWMNAPETEAQLAFIHQFAEKALTR